MVPSLIELQSLVGLNDVKQKIIDQIIFFSQNLHNNYVEPKKENTQTNPISQFLNIENKKSVPNKEFNKLLKINIEKSLKIGDEIAGHFVYGHVDCTTNITNIKKLNNSWEFTFQNFKNKDKNFIVEKGSVAINGISLTIAKQDSNNFSISVIPHTYDNTNLKYLKIQDLVNIEFDYLARFSMKDKL